MSDCDQAATSLRSAGEAIRSWQSGSKLHGLEEARALYDDVLNSGVSPSLSRYAQCEMGDLYVRNGSYAGAFHMLDRCTEESSARMPVGACSEAFEGLWDFGDRGL